MVFIFVALSGCASASQRVQVVGIYRTLNTTFSPTPLSEGEGRLKSEKVGKFGCWFVSFSKTEF